MQALSLSSTLLSHMLSHYMTLNMDKAMRLVEDIIVVNELKMLLQGCS